MSIYVTAGLADVLLDFAAEREPSEANVPLAATTAADLSGRDDRLASIDSETPVLTHFYLPDAGNSVTSVFGVDLGTPAGGSQARFISHPDRPLAVTREDDLAGVILLAVPPWERSSLAAFDRAGRELDLIVLDAEPPVETID